MERQLSFEKVLLLFAAFIAMLIGGRVWYTGTFDFIFLSWNLFLAFLPLLLSNQALRRVTGSGIYEYAVLLLWLLFFPNALYIVTDLIHLQLPGLAPKWYDAVLIFSASVMGLLMGFASLHRVECYLAARFAAKSVSRIIFGLLFLGSFGVYLGRFLRWNSWDVVSDPTGLIGGILHRFAYPLEHSRTWGSTLILTCLFYLIYLAIKKMPGYMNRAV